METKLNIILWDLILGIMKDVLQLGEFKFGPESKDYRYFKSQVMTATYKDAERFFSSNSNLFEKCSCDSNMKRGRNKNCRECQGSSWKTKENK